MNAASLELSKELYALSDHTWLGDEEQNHKPEYVAAPYYTLGYLSRKLPKAIKKHNLTLSASDNLSIHWSAAYMDVVDSEVSIKAHCKDATPEDAACKLAIELFKQGILKKEGQE